MIARVLLVFAAALGAAGTPAAQSDVRFDKRAHLDGYEEVFFSEWSDLYRTAEFDALEGKRVSAEELRAIQTKWVNEVARVRAFLEGLEADPREFFLFRLERRFAKHGYFSRITLERVDGDGVVFYVQKPAKDDPAYKARVAKERGTMVAPLLRHFEEEYARPLGLERREDHGAYVLVVLASQGDMQNYARIASASWHYRSQSYYDHKLRIGVLMEDPFAAKRTPVQVLQSTRHALAHLLLGAHDRATSKRVQQSWLFEGTADYLAALRVDETGNLQRRDTPAEVLRLLVATTQDPAKRLSHYLLVEELLATPTYSHVASRLDLAARKRGDPLDKIDYSGAYYTYVRQSALLAHFLHGAPYRERFLRYLAAELAGEPIAFTEVAGTADAAEFDRAFLLHLYGQYREAFPAAPLDDGAIAAIVAREAVADEAAIAEGAGKVVAPAEAPWTPARVAVSDADTPTRFAAVLDAARRGRTAAANASLGELLDAVSEPKLRERIERERGRLAAWNELRTAYLEHLAATGGELRFQRDGKNVRAPVESFDGERVQLGRNRAKLDAVLAEELDPHALATRMGKADLDAPAWVRIYPYVLAGDAKWKRLLDDSDEDGAALKADAAGDYPDRLKVGAAVGELAELSEVEIPATPAAGNALVERIRGFLHEFGDLAVVEAKRDDLRRLAIRALEVVFDVEGAPQLVKGKMEHVRGETVKLTYEFDDPEELEDFPEVDYLQGRHEVFAPLQDPKPSECNVRGGKLIGVGRGCYRHVLGFEAPMSVRYSMSFGKPASDDMSIWFFMVAICDDGNESFAWAINRFDLEVVNDRVSEAAFAEERDVMYQNSVYKMELRHDGETISMYYDGKLQQSLPCGARKRGGVFLFLHSDFPVSIHRMEIEGKLNEELLAEAREAWAAELVSDF